MIKELPIALPVDVMGVYGSKNILAPRSFFTIYRECSSYGFAIVESMIDVVIYDNDYR